jgi:hypothetical protein
LFSNRQHGKRADFPPELLGLLEFETKQKEDEFLASINYSEEEEEEEEEEDEEEEEEEEEDNPDCEGDSSPFNVSFILSLEFL